MRRTDGQVRTTACPAGPQPTLPVPQASVPTGAASAAGSSSAAGLRLRYRTRPAKAAGRAQTDGELTPIRVRKSGLALALLALALTGGCAQIRERIGLGGPEPGPMPVELPTASAFLGIDRVLRAPEAADGVFERLSFPDSLGSGRLLPGDSALVLDMAGPGVVRRIRLTLASDDPHYLRRLALRMYWDDEEEPSVNVPLGDFFGNGFDRRPYSALPMGASSSGLYSYLAMPFLRHARIVLVNGTGMTVEALGFDADVQVEAELAAPVATFHAEWSRDLRLRANRPHRVADIEGAGWFVGTSLSAQGYDGNLAFLRGGERIRIDGRTVRQTVTPDYVSDPSVANKEAFTGAFQGIVLRDDQRGRIAAYRWHLPDPIPFRSALRLELERAPTDRESADFATVAYWYQTEPHRPLPRLPSPGERKVPEVLIPSAAIYRDDLKLEGTGAGTVRLTIPAPRPDRYEVVVYPEASPGAAPPTVSVRETGRPKLSLDVNPPGAERGDVLPGVVVDTVAVVGRSVELELAAQGGIALPAAVHLRPVPRWAKEWWVIGPWPSAASSQSNPSPALDSVWGPELDPDPLQSYRLPAGALTVWEAADADALGILSLDSHFSPGDESSAYAQAFVRSPDDRRATLLLAAAEPYQLWVNGQPALERRVGDAARRGEQEVPTILRTGWNQVLIKVADAGRGGGIMLRVADPRGEHRWARYPG